MARRILFGPETPCVGESVPVIVANLLPAALVFVVVGFSDTSWQGVPLPLSHAFLGAPGCNVLVSRRRRRRLP